MIENFYTGSYVLDSKEKEVQLEKRVNAMTRLYIHDHVADRGSSTVLWNVL